jgi:hypothetical protein
MSAELLNRAAKVLREHAEAAQNKHPWCPEYTRSAVRHVQRNCDFLECATHGYGADNDCHSFDMYDGKYVALMHPPVALALAHHLEMYADTYPDAPTSVALALAILREES